MSKGSTDSMCSSQRQWDKFGSGGPLKGTLPSRRLISRQSSTTSTSTSRSSGLMGDAAGGEGSSDFDPERCQLIADTLLESMEFLGAQGNLDIEDRFYLEKIFKRVLEWNNVMPVPISKTASMDSVQVADSKYAKKILAKQERHRDANSPRSHAALRERLLKLKHNEKVGSIGQLLQQTSSRSSSQQDRNHQTRRRKDLIIPDEDAADKYSHRHSHPRSSAGKSYGTKRAISHSSRHTSVSSKAFSDNSTSKYSGMSSMSSFSMDNNSPRGSPKGTTETQEKPHHPNLATFLPQYSIPHTGSFESTASPSDHFLLSQTSATSHAERVLMGLGFGAAEGFLPERFLKDWYSKISKAQTEPVINAELKRQESVNKLSVNDDVNNQRHSQTLKDSPPCRRRHAAHIDLPAVHDKCTKLERLKEYIAAYTSNISSTDEDKEMTHRRSSFSRQKSLPLSLEALSKLEGKSRHSGMDSFDKESKLEMFISDNKPNNRNNASPEYSRNGRHRDTGCSSESLNTDCREHLLKKTTHKHLKTHIEETIGSLQQIIQRQLINSDVSGTHEDSHAKVELYKHDSQYLQTNKQRDGTIRCSLRDISNGNSCIARALRSPRRQVAVDVCDAVCKADRSDNKQQNITEEVMHKATFSKTYSGKEDNVPDICQRTPFKTDSVLSKDSEEVADIMQNQPTREQNGLSTTQHHNKVTGSQGRPLKSALKHVEPAMVSIVLEDTDQSEGRCNADIVSVSQEGIHLVIPLSACNSPLSPIPQSPVTVIEVGLDNQQDSLDTEGTYSSKDTEDDSFNHPTMFYCGEYSAIKPNHDRRRSLSSLSPKPEHPLRRRSTGIISPIPCQLSLIQVPSSTKAGQPHRRLSLEVPAIPEIRNLLEKQKGLLTTQSKDSLEEPKKCREKRRASFSEAEPIIINDVLARQRCPPTRDERAHDSRFDNDKNQKLTSGSQDTHAGQILKSPNVSVIESNGSQEISNVACTDIHTLKSFGHEKDQFSSNVDPHIRDFIEHKEDTPIYKTHAIQQNNSTNVNINGMCEGGAMRSIDSSPRSAKSAFKLASKKHVENSPSSCNGYCSETDAEEFPVIVNPDLKPRPISSIARYLEVITNSLEEEGDTSMSKYVSATMDGMSPPTLKCSDHNPALGGSANSVQEKAKTQMISRAIEVNNSTHPYTTLKTHDNNSQLYSSEYYYAYDKSTQCSLIGSGNQTPSHMMNPTINTYTQTGVRKHEVSSQTTDLFYFVSSSLKIPSHKDRTESKGVNTVVCLIGNEHGNNYLKHSTNYTTAHFNRIDETIREIDAELSSIEIRNYQRSCGINAAQSTERSYPPLPLHGHSDSLYHSRVSSNYYPYQSRGTRERTHTLALKRCAPSNWQDATELINTSHVDDIMCDIIMDKRPRSWDNARKIIVGDYKDEMNWSLIPGAATVTSDVCSSTDLSGTDTDCEEDAQVCIQYANTDLQSTTFVKSSQSSTEDHDRILVKENAHNAGNSYTIRDGDNKNTPAIEIVHPLQLPTHTGHGENKNDPVANTYKSTNEPIKDFGVEHMTSDSKDITLKSRNFCCEKVTDTQSNARAYEHQQELDVTACSLDMSSPRNTSPRQTLVNPKQIIGSDSNESTQFSLPLMGNEQTDKGHSKLSRLKYNQSSHRSSGSSFDIELDFMNAGDPIGMSKCSDHISPAVQDSKRNLKKQKHVQEIFCPTQIDIVIKEANIIPESNTQSVSHLNMSTNVSHKTRPDEQRWYELSSTSKETLVKSSELNRETKSDSGITETVETILTDTDTPACYCLAADATVNKGTPLLASISKTQLENANKVKGTPANVMAINYVNADSLQLPGSPEHLFKRANYQLLSRTNSTSTSLITSPTTQTRAYIAMNVEDENMSVLGVADLNIVSTDRSEEVDVVSAVHQLDDNREGNKTNMLLTNVSGASKKAICHFSSVEKSCNEHSDASVYSMLSIDYYLDGNHKENCMINAKGKENNISSLDNDEAGSFHVIADQPPVFDRNVPNISHKVRRSQSAGDWPSIDGVQDTCDVDSNKSMVGSELNHDTDDMDDMETESRKQRSDSESSYSEAILDLSDSLSQGSDSTQNIKKDVNKACLLTTAYNTDDLLQVSDFGAFSPTSLQRNSPSGENLSLSPSNSIRSQEMNKHSPSCTPVRSPSREFPPEPIQCNDSDDELDSETELKIREQLRQVRRESRRNSKDNWDAIQPLLLSQNMVSDDSPANHEETLCSTVQTSDNAVSLTSPAGVATSEVKSCPVDTSSADECDQEISRINLNRPVTRKLIKMSSDPVDKDMYCRSVALLSAKEKTSQPAQHNSVVEESVNDFENGGLSCSEHAPEAVIEMVSLSEFTNNSMSDKMGESNADVMGESIADVMGESIADVMGESIADVMGESIADLKLLDINYKAFDDMAIKSQVEESWSMINDQIDLNANNGNKNNATTRAARILEVEFINDDVDKDTPLITDRQDSLQESSTNILDELEIIALFKKIDGDESSMNPNVDYSSESTASVEFKLSQISEEDTQSEDNTSDESRRHIWQVRSRFVLPQDTVESTLDGITRQESVGSRSSWSRSSCHSDNSDSLPYIEDNVMSGSNAVTQMHESYSNDYTVTHNLHTKEATSHTKTKANIETETAATSDAKTEAISDAKTEPTNDTQNELQHDGPNLKSFLTYPKPSHKEDSATAQAVLSHPNSQFEQQQQKNAFVNYVDNEIPNSLKSTDTYSQLNECDNSKAKARSLKKTSVFCDVSPAIKLNPAYETQTLEWKTDATGNISTTVTNTHVVKTLHLNSSFNNLYNTNGHKDSVTEMQEDGKHTSTMEFLVGDHRRIHGSDNNHPQPSSDQLSAKIEADLRTVSNGKYSTDIEDTLAAKAILCLCGNSSPQNVTDNTVEQENNLERHDAVSDASKQKEVCIGKFIPGKLPPHDLNDLAAFDVYHNNINTIPQTQNRNSECSTQNDLKNKVRSMFLIDRITTSRGTVKDAQSVDDSCVNTTGQDVKDTSQAMFIIDKSNAETTSEDTLVNGWGKHNNDSTVPEHFADGRLNWPTEISDAIVESNSWNHTELCNTRSKSGKSGMPVDVSLKVLSAFFSETVESEDLFESTSEFTDSDFRLNESPTQKLVESNINSDQHSLNSCCEDILIDNTNYNSGDWESRISLPQVHLNEVISLLVPSEEIMSENMFKGTTRNNMKTDNSMNSININTHNLTGDICTTDESCSVFEHGSTLPVSEREVSGNESNNNPVPRSFYENESSSEGSTFDGSNIDTLKNNFKSVVGFDHSKTISIQEAEDPDDIKKRVKAMFLLGGDSDSSSSDSKPDKPASSTELSSPSPAKRIANVSTVMFENSEQSPISFATSSLEACVDAQTKDLDEEGESLHNGILTNSHRQINEKEMKTTPSGVTRIPNKSLRVLKCRNSLLKLHEQMNVFSSIGSDSDAELTLALTNQGDYDIRKRDLSLGRISSDNNDEEESGVSTDIRSREEMGTGEVSDSTILEKVSNEATTNGKSLEDSEQSSSVATLVNSNSNSVQCDVTGALPGTDPNLTPKVVIQQPSEEELLLKNTVTSSASATMVQNPALRLPVLSETKENANYTEHSFIPAERRHCSKRFSARLGSSWLRNNPHANLLTPERALTHKLQYNHAVNHSPYTRIQDDSHPELSYLDIVSKLKQQEVYKAKPDKKSNVELVISAPDAMDRQSKKAVRFTLSENSPSKMSSQHTIDKTSNDVN